MRSSAWALPVALVVLVAVGVGSATDDDTRSLLELSAENRDAGRFDEAEAALERALSGASGEDLHETLFRLAVLKRDAAEAEELYQRIIGEEPKGEWAKRAHLELAKVQYALGNYSEAYNLLADTDACGVSDEACLFHGLSAVMLERFARAERPLSRIRRGRLKTWAHMSLAEAAMGRGRKDEACERYESLAGTLISPTALYRHAECLEDRGDVEGAVKEYREILRSFRDTPEAVLASEKLQLIREGPGPAQEPPPSAEHGGVEVLDAGFTLQFGSFRDRGNAIKLAAKIKRLFPGARIDSELVRYREYHRVRYGYYRTRAEAQAKGDEISRQTGEDYTIMTLP
jgi:tetratricopeptide (TPR) repeat protein